MCQCTMSLFKMSRKIQLVLERQQSDFLWDGGLDKKDHLVNWGEICRPKEFKGLGLGHFKERNHALLGKWLWWFSNEADSL